MRHYLTSDEFKEIVLRERPFLVSEFELDCEDIDGNTTYIRFREEQFFGRIILYTSVFMEGVGILQDDAMGWDTNIQILWEALTENYEMRPFIVVEDSDKNLF